MIALNPSARAALSLAASLLLNVSLPAAAESELERLKQNTQQWIEASSRLAKEKSDWASERQNLRSSITSLEASVEALEAELRRNRLKTGELQKKLEQTQSLLEKREGVAEMLEKRLFAFESRIVDTAKLAPAPLQRTLAPLLGKTEQEGPPDLSARYQNLVAMASRIDAFNGDIHLVNTVRSFDDGATRSVRILYWGMAVGHAIDEGGNRAWELRPAPGEWIWTPRHEQAERIERLFSVYEKRRDPEYVAAPVTLWEEENEERKD